MATLGIIGAGRYGGLVRDLAECTGQYESYVFFDDQLCPLPEDRNVIGKLDSISSAYKEKRFDHLAMAVGYKHFELRNDLFGEHLGEIPFATLIHPTASISSGAKISEGAQIYSMVNVEIGAQVGEGVAVFNNTSITHEVEVKPFSFLSVGVSMGGGVKIGKSCFIGVGASLVNDIEIGSNCVVCGGTFLTKSIPDGTCVIGNPYREIDKPQLA